MKIREPRLDSYQLPEEEALRRHFLIAFGWGSSEGVYVQNRNRNGGRDSPAGTTRRVQVHPKRDKRVDSHR